MSKSGMSESAIDLIKSKIGERTAQVGIIGLGYVGLPLALLYCEQGFPVTGFDNDASKINTLKTGGSYIHRIPSTEIQAAAQRGFTATYDYSQLAQMDAIILCVPTPLNEHQEPDLSYIESSARAIGLYLRPGQLIVLESTTYPGTTDEVLVPILESSNPSGLRCARDGQQEQHVFYAAFSPEREDPGNDSVARRDIPKVVGAMDEVAGDIAAALYQSIFAQIVRVSTPAVAEMTKLLENIYRCVNIALVNELKLLCLRMGINIWEVIEAASTKPFGFQPFYPGPGLGGHCIPIDPFYLSWRARKWDFYTRFIELAGEINSSMPAHVVAVTAKALNEHKKALNGSRILVLGVAYKKDIDDLRESPALTIIKMLQEHGAEVSYNDPYFPTIGKGRHYNLNLSCTPLDRMSEFDCVVVVTDHSDYDFGEIVKQAQLLVDSRNATKGISSSKIHRA